MSDATETQELIGRMRRTALEARAKWLEQDAQALRTEVAELQHQLGQATEAVTELARPQSVAAVHALAAFLAEHIDVPRPHYAQLHSTVETREQLEQLATAYDTPIYGERGQISIRVEVGGLDACLVVYVKRGEPAL